MISPLPTPRCCQYARKLKKIKISYLYTWSEHNCDRDRWFCSSGLGNIGGYAAIPVMEESDPVQEFADIDAFPICFENYDTDFTDQIKNIAPFWWYQSWGYRCTQMLWGRDACRILGSLWCMMISTGRNCCFCSLLTHAGSPEEIRRPYHCNSGAGAAGTQ